MNPEKITEAEAKLAAIRKWVIQEHQNMSYFQIVQGIKAVLDWSIEAQERDNKIVKVMEQYDD